MTMDTNNYPEQTRQTRRRHLRENRSSWVGGAVLIALGFIFLMQNYGFYRLDNWWALFILIPAFSALGAAWTIYRNNGGHFSPAMTGSLVTGVLLTLLTIAFLLGRGFDMIWPVFLILGGLSILFASMAERR